MARLGQAIHDVAGYFLGVSGRDIAQQFASGATSALDSFAQSIANGANAFRSLGAAFRQFAADFLRQIAQMTAQQAFFNLISGLISAGAGAAAGGTGNGSFIRGAQAQGFAVAHEGGIAGDPSLVQRRTGISPARFARQAARYHVGVVAGLRPGEIPAILMQGEEVLARNDPRHVMNGGGGTSVQNIKIVNAFESGDMLSEAMGTEVGQRAVINLLRANRRAIKGVLE